MDLDCQPAWHYSLPELADLLNRAYAGYFVPLHFTPPGLANMLRVHGIDLHTSQVASHQHAAVGIALLAHRGWTTRLAAMGVVPESRGLGVGRELLDRALTACRAHGDRTLTLEVIEANTRAIRLYERVGFAPHRRLLGYRCDSPRGEPSSALEEIDVREVADLLLRVGPVGLPWQVSGETVAQLRPPARGFRLGDAVAVVQAHEAWVELLALVVSPERRRRGAATRLLQALFALHAGAGWRIVPRFPEEVPADLFTRLGFDEDPLRQVQMFLRLV